MTIRVAIVVLALLVPLKVAAYDNDEWNSIKADIAKSIEKRNQLAKEIDAMTKKNNEGLNNPAYRTIPAFDPEIELSLVSPRVRKVFKGIRAGGGSWIIGTPGLYEVAVQLGKLAKDKEKK
jgi:hypothetical protein